jgi:hypothetical protein
MAGILYNVLERFSIIKHLLCITTDNARNNSTIRKELEELIKKLDVNNNWSSESTEVPYLAHVIQLIVKAILCAFNIGQVEEQVDDVNGGSVCSAIVKVSFRSTT